MLFHHLNGCRRIGDVYGVSKIPNQCVIIIRQTQSIKEHKV